VAFARNTAQIDAEAALDGVYVLHTSFKPQTLDDAATVKAYKQLAQAERAFRNLKTVDIEGRPIRRRRPTACAPAWRLKSTERAPIGPGKRRVYRVCAWQ
jgi:hypothetical protein